MDLRFYVGVLRRSWLLLVLPALLGVVVAAAVLSTQAPRYSATASVFVSAGTSSNVDELTQGNAFAQTAATNYASLALEPYVLGAVQKQLNLTLSPDELASMTSTTVQQSTSIISIEVTDESARRGAAIANAIGDQLTAAVDRLTPTSSTGTRTVRLALVRTATAAAAPVSPNRPVGLAVGLLGGLLLGVLLVVARELLDTRIRTVADLRALTGVPNLGMIPRDPAVASHPLVARDGRGSAVAEGFRSLELNLEYVRAVGQADILAVTSAVVSEGKSTVAANLAVALASAGSRVAVVDADLRRPRQHTIFDLDNGVGLTDVLVGRATVEQAAQRSGAETSAITVLTAGALPPNPGELLQSAGFRAALDDLLRTVDVIVVDGPPLLAIADSAILARTADAVLMVASLRRSHRPQVVQAIAALQGVGARLIGTVMTLSRPSRAETNAYTRYSGRIAGTARPARPARARRPFLRPRGDAGSEPRWRPHE